MAVPLDPSGVPIQVGNVILITPDLAGSAESYLPTAPGMRAAESPTEALDAALAAEGFQAQETVELTDTQEMGGLLPWAPRAAPRMTSPRFRSRSRTPVQNGGRPCSRATRPVCSRGTSRCRQRKRRVCIRVPMRTACISCAAGLRRPDDPAPASRGLLGAVGKKMQKIVAFKLIDAVAGEVGDRFVGRWEEKRASLCSTDVRCRRLRDRGLARARQRRLVACQRGSRAAAYTEPSARHTRPSGVCRVTSWRSSMPTTEGV